LKEMTTALTPSPAATAIQQAAIAELCNVTKTYAVVRFGKIDFAQMPNRVGIAFDRARFGLRQAFARD
jgi:hypothetical protein